MNVIHRLVVSVPARVRSLGATVALLLAVALVTTLLALPQQAVGATALSLSIDVQPLFDNIENFLPIFFSILAIAGGIAIAVALAKFIINAVLSGFQGRSL